MRKAAPWLLLLPATALVMLLVVALMRVAHDSFFVLDLATYRLGDEASLANYRQFLERGAYVAITWRSLLAAFIVTALTLVLALPYAYVMVRTRSAALRKLLLVSLFLPFFIGQVVRAYGWLIVLGREGLVNDLLGLLGFQPVQLLYHYPAVLLGLVQYMLPFAILLLAPAITAIPEETELASEGLGANWWRTTWHVLLPLARPGLTGAGVVVFTLTLTDFAMPEILGGGTTDFIANAIYDSFFQISDPGLGSALSVVLVVLGSTIVALVFSLLGLGTLSAQSASKGAPA